MVDSSSELLVAVRALARVSRLVERASDGLSFADFRVMSAIAGGEERASRLAKRLAVGKPAISATVESLSRRGLVVRSTVAGDNRATALTLSPAGVDLFERMQGRMADQLSALADRTDDPRSVIAALAALDDALEETMSERHRVEATA